MITEVTLKEYKHNYVYNYVDFFQEFKKKTGEDEILKFVSEIHNIEVFLSNMFSIRNAHHLKNLYGIEKKEMILFFENIISIHSDSIFDDKNYNNMMITFLLNLKPSFYDENKDAFVKNYTSFTALKNRDFFKNIILFNKESENLGELFVSFLSKFKESLKTEKTDEVVTDFMFLIQTLNNHNINYLEIALKNKRELIFRSLVSLFPDFLYSLNRINELNYYLNSLMKNNNANNNIYSSSNKNFNILNIKPVIFDELISYSLEGSYSLLKHSPNPDEVYSSRNYKKLLSKIESDKIKSQVFNNTDFNHSENKKRI